MTFKEVGNDFANHTGEHVFEGSLDFDVWVYLRPGSGFTVCVRQMPPQPMLESFAAKGVGPADVGERRWTVNIAPLGSVHDRYVTFSDGCNVEGNAPRIPWDELPGEDQAEVISAAACGWEWDGVEYQFDAVTDGWLPLSEAP